MNSGEELLKSIANLASSGEEGEHKIGSLSFELQYKEKPDLISERKKLEKYLGNSNFELNAVHPKLPRFFVLEFPSVERRISPQGQNAIASELVGILGLKSCVPEGAKNFPIQLDKIPPDQQETEIRDEQAEGKISDAILNHTCWSKIDKSLEPTWVGEFLKLQNIWQTNEGEGITIAQPDTGVADHEELDSGLDLNRSLNVITGATGNASDPLSEDAGNPGHGTATGSVIASSHSGQVWGIAPKASLVPIRCIDSVILGIDGTSVAKAIMHAVDINADIISMSLGGPFTYRSIQEAIKIATDNELIVIAAAGNCVKVVVYPASDENTIAVAGVGAKDKPWKGTSKGRSVDISSPSENVFAARRDPDDNGIGTIRPSQGTSFGTALTAGVAALWLKHHGREVVRGKAQSKGMTVNDLFRGALTLTARKPADGRWDSKMGAGILDAQALLDLPLDEIDILQPEMVASPIVVDQSIEDHEEIVKLALEAETVDGFDWARHGAEAVFLSKESLGRNNLGQMTLVESTIRPEPSEALAKAATSTALKNVFKRVEEAPLIEIKGGFASGRVDDLVEGLPPLPQGGLEDNSEAFEERSSTIETRLEKLTRGGGLEAVQNASEGIIRKLNDSDGSEEAITIRQETVQQGIRALDSMREGGDARGLTIDQRIGLEALVSMTDRPAFRIRDGKVSREDPMFLDGGWGETFAGWSGLPQITNAIGRINLGSEHVGTGFLVKMENNKKRIMTNRHVLEAIAEEIKTPNKTEWVFSNKGPNIDFSDPGDEGTSFPIKSVYFAGKERINGVVDLNVLDLVILEIESLVEELPDPLVLSNSQNAFQSKREMFVVGYPARPGPSAFFDPTGKFSSSEISERLSQIFGIAYGRKYLSPGVVLKGTGDVSGDNNDWAFSYDATTLPGCSGSAVIAMGSDGEVVGIHFAGKVMTHNLAHQISKTGAI